MKPIAYGIKWMSCVLCLVCACAQSGERAPARAPSSTEAEEAPQRPIATSLASDPVNEPAQEHQAHEHGMQSESVVYTCPMHHEVQQPGPGECPKCGMKLVPSTKSPQQVEHAHEHAN